MRTWRPAATARAIGLSGASFAPGTPGADPDPGGGSMSRATAAPHHSSATSAVVASPPAPPATSLRCTTMIIANAILGARIRLRDGAGQLIEFPSRDARLRAA